MRIVIFTTCNSATSNNGLLSITGAFTNLLVPRTPMRARFTIVTRLFFSAQEEGLFSGWIRLIDPDGQEVLRNAFELEAPISEADGTGVYIDSIGGFETTFRTAGEFQFQIGKDGEEPVIFPLYVAVKER